MTRDQLEQRLTAIRAEAARRCGLTRYPAELVHVTDQLCAPWLKDIKYRRLKERQALLLARLERLP